MSEQARLLLLQMQLDQVRKSRRNWAISLIVVAIFFGFVWNGYGFDFFTGLVLTMFFGTLGEYVVLDHYGKQETAILWQIEQMAAVIQKCPSCGKDVPQGNFDFCPFCGNSLRKVEKSVSSS